MAERLCAPRAWRGQIEVHVVRGRGGERDRRRFPERTRGRRVVCEDAAGVRGEEDDHRQGDEGDVHVQIDAELVREEAGLVRESGRPSIGRGRDEGEELVAGVADAHGDREGLDGDLWNGEGRRRTLCVGCGDGVYVLAVIVVVPAGREGSSECWHAALDKELGNLPKDDCGPEALQD